MARKALPRDQQILHLRAWRQDVREFVAHRANYRCECCFVFLGMNGEADHVISRRELAKIGGNPFDVSNIQFLCGSCHSRKTNSERWQGHSRRPRTRFYREKLPGRERFLAAAGIPDPETLTPSVQTFARETSTRNE